MSSYEIVRKVNCTRGDSPYQVTLTFRNSMRSTFLRRHLVLCESKHQQERPLDSGHIGAVELSNDLAQPRTGDTGELLDHDLRTNVQAVGLGRVDRHAEARRTGQMGGQRADHDAAA